MAVALEFRADLAPDARTALAALVAVWATQPSAPELLAARLARGWVPTPTATRGGDVVLGYAACAPGPVKST